MASTETGTSSTVGFIADSRISLVISSRLDGVSLEVSVIQIDPATGPTGAGPSSVSGVLAGKTVFPAQDQGRVFIDFSGPGGPCRPLPGKILAVAVSTGPGCALQASATVTVASPVTSLGSPSFPATDPDVPPGARVIQRPDGTRLIIGRARP
jgi:hypothetical protein